MRPSSYLPRIHSGDIVVMHDGDESAPGKDQRGTVEAAAMVIPALRARGFVFDTVCRNQGAGSSANMIDTKRRTP